MIHRFLLCTILFALVVSYPASPQPGKSNIDSNVDSNLDSNVDSSVDSNLDSNYDHADESWMWSGGSEEGGGTSYLGVDIADVSAERLGELKLKGRKGGGVNLGGQDDP